MMKVLLFGRNGQVGFDLVQRLDNDPGVELVALDRAGFGGLSGDLTDPSAIASTVLAVAPNVVINAAAYTAVDRAEEDRDTARLVNADSVEAMAKACREIGALLVSYSTDYVFDGSGMHARDENESVSPVNVYGQTKAAGEKAVAASGCRYLMLRTSWVQGVHGANFMKTILRLAREKEALTVVDDQKGTPATADFIADTTLELINRVSEGRAACGIYHLVPDGCTDWCAFAKWIVQRASAHGALKLAAKAIAPVPSSAYPRPAARPLNSRLDNAKLKRALGRSDLGDWSGYCAKTLDAILQTEGNIK